MYGTVAGVRNMTGIRPQDLDQEDDEALDQLLEGWLNQATGVINRYLQRDLEAEAAANTTLAAAAARGARELELDGTGDLAPGDDVVVGPDLRTDLVEITAINDASGKVQIKPALRYPHDQGNPVRRPGTLAAVPADVHLAAERLVANLVGFVAQRRTAPIIQTGDYTVQLSSDAVFTEALRADLRPLRRRPSLFLAGPSPREDDGL